MPQTWEISRWHSQHQLSEPSPPNITRFCFMFIVHLLFLSLHDCNVTLLLYIFSFGSSEHLKIHFWPVFVPSTSTIFDHCPVVVLNGKPQQPNGPRLSVTLVQFFKVKQNKRQDLKKKHDQKTNSYYLYHSPHEMLHIQYKVIFSYVTYYNNNDNIA